MSDDRTEPPQSHRHPLLPPRRLYSRQRPEVRLLHRLPHHHPARRGRTARGSSALRPYPRTSCRTPTAVGGLTMGADPLVSNTASASAWYRPGASGDAAGPRLPGPQGRKAHGTGRRLEGFHRLGAHVVIVDDVCTTGGSTITAIEADEGIRHGTSSVSSASSTANRADERYIEATAPGAPFHALFTANDVRAAHLSRTER